LAPVIVSGNVAVLLASEPQPMTAVTFAEVLESSDVPAGVVNILTGSPVELAPWLADHMDVNAIDLAGADSDLRLRIEQGAVHNVKRIIGLDGDLDLQSPYLIAAFTELKTVWHPKGL
jgi:acyl-CoA reductase-like NAD-dependent aldehyde dehydrogenase